MAGSVITIFLVFLALSYAFRLNKLEPENYLWGFLFYFCIALAAFAVSRCVGHIARELLLMRGKRDLWLKLSPYSGGFNTLLMISVAAVTIYYHKGVEAYRTVKREAEKIKVANLRLKDAAEEMKKMNIYLEEMVDERTRELSESEKKFRDFFTHSKDMVFFSDRESKVVDINESGLEMLGFTEEDASSLTLPSLFNKNDDIKKYYKALEEVGYIKDFEVEFKKRDGTILYVLLSATALYDANGKISGCEGIAKDLTRVKTMMEQLAKSEKMASIGQMAAGVAHEINTPLGVILGYTQLMMDDFPKDQEGYQNLAVIERQAKSCRKIVADLLKFSRQSESKKENLNINSILADVIAVTEHNLHLDHIKVVQELNESVPLIVGDAEKLRQVFVNFFNNAHHAMEDSGGTLFVSTAFIEEAHEVVVTVRDTGTGIPKEIKNKIFDPFFTTKTVDKGTGLGLSVSYGIIKDHGGEIEVESPVIDRQTGKEIKGTAFRVRLPVAQGELKSISE